MNPEMKNMTKQEMRRAHSDSGVPSSANWNPTKPLMSRQQKVAATRPVYTAANHCNIRQILNHAGTMKDIRDMTHGWWG